MGNSCATYGHAGFSVRGRPGKDRVVRGRARTGGNGVACEPFRLGNSG